MTINIEKLAQDMFGTVLVNGKEYYEIDSKEWDNLAEAYAAKVLEDKEREIASLKLNINDLREAGKAVVERWDSPKWSDGTHTKDYIDALRKALSKTQAQSLQDYERLASIRTCARDVCPDSIRTLES